MNCCTNSKAYLLDPWLYPWSGNMALFSWGLCFKSLPFRFSRKMLLCYETLQRFSKRHISKEQKKNKFSKSESSQENSTLRKKNRSKVWVIWKGIKGHCGLIFFACWKAYFIPSSAARASKCICIFNYCIYLFFYLLCIIYHLSIIYLPTTLSLYLFGVFFFFKDMTADFLDWSIQSICFPNLVL